MGTTSVCTRGGGRRNSPQGKDCPSFLWGNLLDHPRVIRLRVDLIKFNRKGGNGQFFPHPASERHPPVRTQVSLAGEGRPVGLGVGVKVNPIWAVDILFAAGLWTHSHQDRGVSSD